MGVIALASGVCCGHGIAIVIQFALQEHDDLSCCSFCNIYSDFCAHFTEFYEIYSSLSIL